MPAFHESSTNQITIDLIGPESQASDFALSSLEILRSRGLDVRISADPPSNLHSAMACILPQEPTQTEAKALANKIEAFAENGMPTLLFLPTYEGKNRERHAACQALLRSSGAVVVSDPEIWVECAILLAVYGAPSGPQISIVAPPQSWLANAAAAQKQRAEKLGQRFSPLFHDHQSLAPTDILIFDLGVPLSTSNALQIPVSGKPELWNARPVLLGLANSLRAAELCGHACARIQAGHGPAPTSLRESGEAPVDTKRYLNQESKVRESAGDHECKVLLSSYAIAITRQAVATTPSAATRIAKKAGYPVEVKAWGPNQPSEAEGCALVTGIETASDVRRAFAKICASADCEAVIIRETPMPGREIRISVRAMGALGLMVFLHERGQAAPATGLAPLRPIDAESMARQVVSSRDGDDDPDWHSLRDLLIRASHLVADNPRILSLELSRVVIGKSGEGSIVIDARAELQPN